MIIPFGVSTIRVSGWLKDTRSFPEAHNYPIRLRAWY